MLITLENYKKVEKGINDRLLQSDISTIKIEDISTIVNCKGITIKELDNSEYPEHLLMVHFNQDNTGSQSWLKIDLDKTSFAWNSSNCNAIELITKPILET